MNRILIFIIFSLISYGVCSQTIAQKLEKAIKLFEADSQMRHAITGICVADAKTGKVVYEHNSQVGLAPASTQKIFTSVAVFELLGKDYRYKTVIRYSTDKNQKAGLGYIRVQPSGDPTFGSWRYTNTKPDYIFGNIIKGIKSQKINKVSGAYFLLSSDWSPVNTPAGWIFEDIGNYYGAGARQFNWLENQYDIVLHSGKKVGDPVTIAAIRPAESREPIDSYVTSAEKGSGDNAFVYRQSFWDFPIIEGTIPVNEDSFVISASQPDPEALFKRQLGNKLKEQVTYEEQPASLKSAGNRLIDKPDDSLLHIDVYTHFSPALDSINYWFLKKSVNLYGEALIKTLALEKEGFAYTEKGVEILRNFWSQHGIDKGAVNVMDGSGLSPQNRVTTDAEVKVLQYAKTRPWFNSFYNALPEFNGMKMKSGAIGGARAYAGYQTASNGAQYIFSIIVNNYTGSSSEAVKKIYKVLDVLK